MRTRIAVAEPTAMSFEPGGSHTCRDRNEKVMKMARIVVTEFVSLDGVVEDPGGIKDFRHGGWVFQIDRGEGGERFKLEETLGSEALLLGRVTYEEFVAAWPSRKGEFADKFNSLPKYVVSSTLEDPEWNSTVLEGDVEEEVSRLRRELDGDIVVHGSTRLARTLIESDLVDELRLMVYPVVLVTGERLFGELDDKKPMRLVDAKTVGDGVAILIYEPVRDARQSDTDSEEDARAASLSAAGIRER
jgi:dihydrofolate reductase